MRVNGGWIQGGTLTSPRAVAGAWIAWGVLFLVIAAIVLSGSGRTVVPVYRQAAAHWINGEPLYTDTGHGFLYLPHAAILMAPLAALPPLAAEVLWRLLTISVYALGVRRLAALAGRDCGVELFPLMTLLCIPVAGDSARNGQSTLLVAALMILAVVDLTDRRWWRATGWLVLGLAIKPLIAPLLLTAAIFRPMWARLPVGLAILLLAPFLAQRTGYVQGQYEAWAGMMGAAGRVGTEGNWANLFGLMGVAGIAVPAIVQGAAWIAGGAATVALCVAARRRHGPARAGLFLLAFNACALMLLSPRTEINTYSALAPAMAAFCAWEFLVARRMVAAWTLFAIIACTAGGYEICRLLSATGPAGWLAPAMALCFTAYVLVRLFQPAPAAAARPPAVNQPQRGAP
jgi:hypothetical protein